MIDKERPAAVNDNTPRHADQFADPAERRAWLASLPSEYKPVLAWPTIERLSRLESPAAAKALYSYAELMNPAKPIAANDNDPSAPAMDADARHEVRPSIDELMRAADADLVVTFACKEDASTGWRIITENDRPVAFVRGTKLVGSLAFRGGKLVSWGTTAHGQPLKALERQRMPRGAARPARSEATIRRDLLSKGDMTPIAKGARFLAGIKGKKGITTRPDVGDFAAGEEMARNQRQWAVRLALAEKAWILDLAIGDTTAREIGELLGATGKTAERRGIAAINDAIAEFQKIAA